MRGRDREATLFRMELELLHRLAGAAALSHWPRRQPVGNWYDEGTPSDDLASGIYTYIQPSIRTLTRVRILNLGETLLVFVDTRSGTHTSCRIGTNWPLQLSKDPWPLLALAIHNAHDCRSWRAWLRMCRTGTYMPSRQNWASCGFVGRIGRIVGGCRRISLYISVSQMMHGFVICRVKYPDLANKSLIAFFSPAWCRYKVSGLMQKTQRHSYTKLDDNKLVIFVYDCIWIWYDAT